MERMTPAPTTPLAAVVEALREAFRAGAGEIDGPNIHDAARALLAKLAAHSRVDAFFASAAVPPDHPRAAPGPVGAEAEAVRLAIGWMYAWACVCSDNGKDPRTMELPRVAGDCLSALAKHAELLAGNGGGQPR